MSNDNSFRVLFDKIASVYFFEKYIYILALEMASPGNQHCAHCIGTLSLPTAVCGVFVPVISTVVVAVAQPSGPDTLPLRRLTLALRVSLRALTVSCISN